jgi:hypothetical protein
MYECFKLGICKMFEQHVSGFCVSVDGWTSESQNKNYIGIVVSFILDWERKTCLLSLKESDSESQTADVIAHAIYELRSFNIQSKLFAMVSDNGSNVVAAWPILINLLAKDGIYVDEHMHARCVCHVVNILVRQFLKHLGANLCLSQAVADNDVCSHAHAVNIVRFMTSFVHSSPKRLNKFKAQQSLAGQVVLPKTETITRWNSTFLMRARALVIKDALSAVFASEDTASHLLPKHCTWKCVQVMINFLSPFHKISMDLQNGDMGLNSAIPSYSELFNHVDDWLKNLEEKMGSRSLSDVIAWKTALEKSQDVLRKYYSKTDSRLYSSVTYCDPRMRHYYWRDTYSEAQWISKAKQQI